MKIKFTHNENYVKNRTFVAEDGARWIVDYKTAIPNDSNIEAFLDAQQQQYQTQLQRYAQAMRARDKERSIRLGLYFPLCGLWREWPAEIGSQNLSTVMKPV
jgi:ATP-dependent helicase/nuclease subunit A